MACAATVWPHVDSCLMSNIGPADAIRDALPQFNPAECANYFTAAGYEPE